MTQIPRPPEGSLPKPDVFIPVRTQPQAYWTRLAANRPNGPPPDRGPMALSLCPTRIIQHAPQLQPDSPLCSQLNEDVRHNLYEIMLNSDDRYIHILATWDKRLCSVHSRMPKDDYVRPKGFQRAPTFHYRYTLESGGASRDQHSCFGDVLDVERWTKEDRRCGIELWSLMLTCRLLYKEVTYEVFRNATFLVTHLPVLPRWEQSLRKIRFNSIRRLHLGLSFSIHSPRRDSLLCYRNGVRWYEDSCETLSRMKGLQILVVRLSYGFIMHRGEELTVLEPLRRISHVKDFRVSIDWCNNPHYLPNQLEVDRTNYEGWPFIPLRYAAIPTRESLSSTRRSFEDYGPPIFRHHQLIH